MSVTVTDKDRESARVLARAFYDVASPEARDKAEEGIAYRLAAEREWALAQAVEELRAAADRAEDVGWWPHARSLRARADALEADR